MSTVDDLRTAFRDLHRAGDPLLLPNAWDVGSARLMAALGAHAVATTSSGFAATLGRTDGDVGAEEVLAHAAQLTAGVQIPVNADLENGYADDLALLAEHYRRADLAGLAGVSIEDWSGSELYSVEEAAERVAVAREAAPGVVLTGRAEGFLHDRADLAEAIQRLQRYVAAGADVVYAPGVTDLADLRTLIAEVGAPVNVLLMSGMEVAAVADTGAARISVGGALAWTAWDAAATATRQFLGGSGDWLERSAAGREAARPVIG